MLNKNGERELAYLVKVEAITPMNADRLECAHIGGWHCVVGKGEFKVGDPAVYFEIDSQLPDVEPFSSMEFLKSKNFKIKSQKIRGEISQGLLMPLSAWVDKEDKVPAWLAALNITLVTNGLEVVLESEAKFLTQALGVTYADPGDNTRKSSGPDKYKKMSARHLKIFKQKWAKWMMRREWGRKVMFFFFGKKKDKKNSWPAWVKKTDEERIQNCPDILKVDTKWIATEKIDGSSTTFTLRKQGRKYTFLVCSRNVAFDKPDKKCFYDTNIYTEMAEKYHMESVLHDMMTFRRENLGEDDLEFITIQAETYGAGVQRRDYGLKDHDMAIFNIIFGYKDGYTIRLNPNAGLEYAKIFNLPYVPVVSTLIELPKTSEEVVAMADGKSAIDGGMREGLVFRSSDGTLSFKAVSNDFLIKYHN